MGRAAPESLGSIRTSEPVPPCGSTGDRNAAVTEVFVGALETSVEEVETMLPTPLWASHLAVAHTIPRAGQGVLCDLIQDLARNSLTKDALSPVTR